MMGFPATKVGLLLEMTAPCQNRNRTQNRRNFWRRAAVLSLVALLLIFFGCGPVRSAQHGPGFAGLEFMGSSLISRMELEKFLHLHPGASLQNIYKAIEKMQIELEKKRVKTNIDLVPEDDKIFIAVDVVDTGLHALPNRKLNNPRHIAIPNEKPFALLTELRTRLQKVIDEGKSVSESYTNNGFREYSDFPSTRITEVIAKEIAGERPYLLQVLACDPNNERRADTVELLNWCEQPVQNCAALIPALDDSDLHVRAAAAKYIWARIPLLPDDFPYDSILEALSREITRPSHHDRVGAMSALIALAKRDSNSITGIKTFDEAKLKEIADNSIIPSVQEMSRQLLSVCANPPPIVERSKPQSNDSGSGF